MEVLLIAALTVLGFAIRLAGLGQSLFGDELSTYWVVLDHHGLKGVWDVVHSDAEITPPLFFLLSKLTTQIKANPEMLRLPSLIAGTATIPLTYLLGARTIGKRGGAVAAALVTLSPFMIYYSTEARGYAVMIALMLASTLCLLRAVEKGEGVRWWVAYGAFSCAAMYTHYTVAFVLAGQALWALWYHPPARRGVLLANLGAALAYLPWVSGAIADFNSPTTDIASVLLPFTPDAVASGLVHWSVGYPWGLSVSVIPGYPALILIGAGILISLVALLASVGAGIKLKLSSSLLLVVVLAAATPVGEALVSAVTNNLFGTRNLAASWLGLGLFVAALVIAPASRAVRVVCVLLVLAGFGIGAVKMLGDRGQRPAYGEPVQNILAGGSRRSDVVIDSSLTPGPFTTLDTELPSGFRVVRLGIPQEHDHPFSALDPKATPRQVAALASAAVERNGRIFVLGSLQGPFAAELRQLLSYMRPAFRVSERRTYAGFNPVEMWTLRRLSSKPTNPLHR